MKRAILAAILIFVATTSFAESIENDLDGNASALQSS